MKNHLGSTYKNIVTIYILLALVFGALFLVRHHFFIRNLPNYSEFANEPQRLQDFPKLTTEQSVNLGWAHSQTDAPSNSYLFFSKQKPEGTIRIGIFGDSFVQGIEAEQGFDFPSFLQRKFINHQYTNVEVINFGVAGYGMHQAFLLWKYLGASYSLDYTIFMPLQFHLKRDRSFVFGYNDFAPVHARYVLVDGRLKLQPVSGKTRAEAGLLYNSIMLPWKYVRYDEKPPAFLRALLPLNHTFPINPFYYRLNDRDQEILTTYAGLFEELSRYPTKFIVICNEKLICDLENDITTPAPIFFRSQVSKFIGSDKMLYTAPRTHLSALGNQLRADELFSILENNQSRDFKVIRVDTHTFPTFSSSQGIPLYQSHSAGIEIRGHRVASLMVHRSGQPSWIYDEDLDLQKYHIATLLRIVGDEHLRLLPVTFHVSDHDPVFLRFMLDNVVVQAPVGVVHASSPYLGNIELFGWDRGECFYPGEIEGRICFGQPDWRYVTFDIQGTIRSVELVIGEKHNVILRGRKKGIREQSVQFAKRWLGKKTEKLVRLTPAIVPFAMLRAKKGEFINISNLQEKEGTLDLVTVSNSGTVFSHPIVPYKILPTQESHQSHVTLTKFHMGKGR